MSPRQTSCPVSSCDRYFLSILLLLSSVVFIVSSSESLPTFAVAAAPSDRTSGGPTLGAQRSERLDTNSSRPLAGGLEGLTKSRRNIGDPNTVGHNQETSQAYSRLGELDELKNLTNDPDYLAESVRISSLEQNTNEASQQQQQMQDTDGQSLNDEIERLVRNQVELAATDWATVAPDDYLLSLRDLSQFANETTSRHQPQHFSTEQQQPFQLLLQQQQQHHPNHQYQGNESYQTGPLLATGGLGSELDTMTTLPDASNDYGAIKANSLPMEYTTPQTERREYPTNYLYRMRGPITGRGSNGTFQDHNNPTTSHPDEPQASRRLTIAPEVLRALKRLDSLRGQHSHATLHSTTGQAADAQSRAGTSLHTTFSSPSATSGRLQERFGHPKPPESSLVGANINSLGFIDSPVFEGSNATANGQPTGESSTAGRAEQQLDKLAGSLAARLAANRYRNKARQYQTSTTAVSPVTGVDKPGPLTINLSRAGSFRASGGGGEGPGAGAAPGAGPILAATTEAPIYSSPTKPFRLPFKTTKLPSRQSQVMSLLGSRNMASPPLLFRPTVGPSLASSITTLGLPSSAATTAASTTTTTATTTLLPPSVLAKVLQEAVALRLTAAANQSSSSTAQHHHLHSHIHSIKQPTVISIPLPIQPKQTNYDTLLAAATAAAAAAAASASNSNNNNNSRPRARQTASKLQVGPGQRIPSFLSSPPSGLLPSHLSADGSPIQHTLIDTIPIGGTLASLPSLAAISSRQTTKLRKPAPQQQQSHSKLLTSLKSRAASLWNPSSPSHRAPPPVAQSGSSPKGHGLHPHPSSYLLINQRGSNDGLQQQQQRQQQLGANTLDLDDLRSQWEAALGSESQELLGEPIGLYQVPEPQMSPVGGYLEALLSPQVPPAFAVQGDHHGEQSSSPVHYLENSSSNQQLFKRINGSAAGHLEDLAHPPIAYGGGSLLDWGSSLDTGANDTITDFDNVVFASLGQDPGLLYPIPVEALSGANSMLSMENQAKELDNSGFRPILEPMSIRFPPRAYITTATKAAAAATGRTNSSRDHYASNNEATHRPPPTIHKLLQGSNPAISLVSFDDGSPPPPPPLSAPPVQPSKTKHRGHLVVAQQPQKQQIQTSPEQSPRQLLLPSHGGQTPTASNSNNNNNKLTISHISSTSNNNNDDFQSLLDLQHQHNSNNNNNNWQHQHPMQLQLQPIQHHYRHYVLAPGSDLHQALHQAASGSSLRPHIIAASDLVHGHKQHLLDHYLEHHLLHHHHHHQHEPGLTRGSRILTTGHLGDMATSESVRLGAIAPLRGSLLAHFWPLALALLPVMILVAVVAQLVMAAPLAMFALTTLTVSRFAGSVFGPLAGGGGGGSIRRLDTGGEVYKLDKPELAVNATKWNSSELASSIWPSEQRQQQNRLAAS